MLKIVCCFLFVLLFLPNAVINAVQNQEFYHGNKQTMTYHHKNCRFYDCQSCIINLKSQSEAEQSGYKPCKFCIILEEKIDTPQQKDDIQKTKIKPIQTEKQKTPARLKLEPLTVSKAILNLAGNLLILLLIEIVIFGLYNCFIRGDLGFLERWNRFQGWLYGKSTSNQLQHELEQANHEENKLNQAIGIKKILFETWYAIRDVFLWLHRFTGCFINFILLTCFTISSWNDTQFILQTWWKWLNNIGG